jgi:L-asparaginase
MQTTPRILLLYTGGTIGMQKDFKTGALKAFDFNKLLKQIPELKLLDCEIQSLSMQQPIDSSDMQPAYWVQIAKLIEKVYNDFQGFVVLHGSDTMSYTASALSFLLENLTKPVILTGSQLPIGDLRTDAKENLITAIQLASLQQNGMPVIQEVGLYFEYKLYRGNRTTKISAEQFNAFTSPNYPPLAESGVHLNVQTDALWKPKTKKKLLVHEKLDTNVILIKLFPGLSVETLQYMLHQPKIKAVLLETYGAGNAPSDEQFLKVLNDATKRGIHLINVTQCSGGRVQMGVYETSVGLQKIGVISGKDITTEAAICKIMYLLGEEVSPNLFKTMFETSLRGELV